MNRLFLLLIPVTFLASCELPPFEEEDPSAVDVVWSEDWKYITVFLDGRTAKQPNTSLEQGRAMSSDTARRGFNYFEAVFCYGSDVVRYRWKIGDRASINDVPKNVDYSRTSVTPGFGSALLFAGNSVVDQHGKTVLAFGMVYSVDDVLGAYIMGDSAAVTFKLYPLNGAASYSSVFSSLKTAYFDPAYRDASSGNTKIITALIGGRAFPMYVLPLNVADMRASFEFVLDGTAWGTFSSGVIVADKGEAWEREVRYPRGNDTYWRPVYLMDETTKVSMTNNQIKGAPAVSPVTFSIDTSKTINPFYEANGAFLLVFQIPVYCQTDRGLTEMAEDLWYIKTAYASYQFNIDNGYDSTGGGLLMGVFDPNMAVLDVPRETGK